MGYSFGPARSDTDAVDVVVELLAERNSLERVIELAMILKNLAKNYDGQTIKSDNILRRVPLLAKELRQREIMTPAMEAILAKFCVEAGISRD